METATKKRGRVIEQEHEWGTGNTKEQKKKPQQQQHDERLHQQEQSDGFFWVPVSPKDEGVFEFPWQKDNTEPRVWLAAAAASESDAWDLVDVFFSSLVDGSSAKIGFPGDRLSRTKDPFPLTPEDGTWPCTDDEIDGADCIWSSVLHPPLSDERGKISTKS